MGGHEYVSLNFLPMQAANLPRTETVFCSVPRRPPDICLEHCHRLLWRNISSSIYRRNGLYASYCRRPIPLDVQPGPEEHKTIYHLDARLDDLVRLVSLLAGIANITAIIVQQLAMLNNPSYVPKTWHVTMIMIAILTVQGLINSFGRTFVIVPWLELVAGILHVCLFRPVPRCPGRSGATVTAPSTSSPNELSHPAGRTNTWPGIWVCSPVPEFHWIRRFLPFERGNEESSTCCTSSNFLVYRLEWYPCVRDGHCNSQCHG